MARLTRADGRADDENRDNGVTIGTTQGREPAAALRSFYRRHPPAEMMARHVLELKLAQQQRRSSAIGWGSARPVFIAMCVALVGLAGFGVSTTRSTQITSATGSTQLIVGASSTDRPPSTTTQGVLTPEVEASPTPPVEVSSTAKPSESAGSTAAVATTPGAPPVPEPSLPPGPQETTATRAADTTTTVAVATSTVPPSEPTASGPTCHGLAATIVGTNGDDVLTGTDGPDVIVGLNGQDTIYGLDGDDTICGGNGQDLIHGGPGDDRLDGGNGKDRLIGGAGDDQFDDGDGKDTVEDGA